MNQAPRIRSWRVAVWLIGAAAVAIGCSTAANFATEVPPISDSGTATRGRVVWHDLATHDLKAAKRFYGEVFGWTFEDVTSGYTVATLGGRRIAGIAKIDDAQSGSQWIPQVSVDDVDAQAAALAKKGGKVLLGPFDLRGRGRVAIVQDPDGAVFGLIDASNGDPSEREAALNDWLWHEVWANDPQAARGFYSEVTGYDAKTAKLGTADYTYFADGDRPRFGIVAKPDPNIGAAWVSYLRVDDQAAVAQRAALNGGKVLFEPTSEVRQGTVAIIADPGGAAFLVQKWPIG